MKYDKLKKVVNEFILALRDGVVQVTLNIDGIEHRRYLTYVGKEPSIECDPETEYKCVLKCYDHLLEEDIIFRMRDVKAYKRPDSSVIDNIKQQLQLPDGTPWSKDINDLYRNIILNKSKFVQWRIMNYLDIDTGTSIEEVRVKWLDNICKYQDKGIKVLEQEKNEHDDPEFDEEVKIIKQMLEDIPQIAETELAECTTNVQIFEYWPSLLYPRPLEIS